MTQTFAPQDGTEAAAMPQPHAPAPEDRHARHRQRSSLLRRDHVRIGLGSKWIALARYRRGLRPALVQSEVTEVDRADDEHPWAQALDVAETKLTEPGRSRSALTVIVSNDFVRYALLPWSSALKSESEWLALAQHRFGSVYGAVAEQWTIRVAPAARGHARMACAMDTALLDALKEKLDKRGSLVSVQPFLMATYNRLHAALAAADSWLVLEEPGRVTFALIANGSWRAVRSRRTGNEPRTLSHLLDRESALAALDAPCPEIALCTYRPVESDTEGGYRIRDLTFNAGAAQHDPRLAMALE